MKTQNINQNNYQNNQQKNIGFKMNAHAVYELHCPHDGPCLKTMLAVAHTFNDSASKAGAWKGENARRPMSILPEIIGNKLDLLLLKWEDTMKLLGFRLSNNAKGEEEFLSALRQDTTGTIQIKMPYTSSCPNTLIPVGNLTQRVKPTTTESI